MEVGKRDGVLGIGGMTAGPAPDGFTLSDLHYN